jgi:hypothetical protein
VKAPRWLAPAAVVLASAAFAYANRWERVSVSFGVVRSDRVPLPLFFFAAVLLGMAAMAIFSYPADRRTRDVLRAHGLLDDAPAHRPAGGPAPAEPAPVEHAPAGE